MAEFHIQCEVLFGNKCTQRKSQYEIQNDLECRLGVPAVKDQHQADYFKLKAAEECSCESQIWLDSTMIAG
jgi:hypothetical protein